MDRSRNSTGGNSSKISSRRDVNMHQQSSQSQSQTHQQPLQSQHHHPYHLNLPLQSSSNNNKTIKEKKQKQKQNKTILKGILLVVLGFVVIPLLYLQVWLSGSTSTQYQHHYTWSSSQHHHHASSSDNTNDHNSKNSNPVHATLRDFRRRHRYQQYQRPLSSSSSSSSSSIIKKLHNNISSASSSTATSTTASKRIGTDTSPDRQLEQKHHVQQQQSSSSSSSSKTTTSDDGDNDSSSSSDRSPVLTAYLESPSTLSTDSNGILVRNTTSSRLTKVEYPQMNQKNACHRRDDSGWHGLSGPIVQFPIDDYPTGDPYLPWVHDYFVSEDLQYVRFVAQNRRRCDTGPDHTKTMEYWEPQISLFQPIPIDITVDGEEEGNNYTNNERNTAATTTKRYKISSSVDDATYPATRFQCRFYNSATQQSVVTMSEYKFDYEYVSWRKWSLSSSTKSNRNIMFDRDGGKDNSRFWLSTLLFECPVPKDLQPLLDAGDQFDSINQKDFPDDNNFNNQINTRIRSDQLLYLDLIPIRTPPRSSDEVLLTENHVGPDSYQRLHRFDLEQHYGTNHILPAIEDAGRWANLPLCPRQSLGTRKQLSRTNDNNDVEQKQEMTDGAVFPTQKPYKFVACTWASASYTRRGDAVRLSDSADRLREWIIFHLMVGVDHIYVYDNTDPASNNTVLWDVANEFNSSNQVTYQSWPCTVCNNNRPAHSNPGERSSQYAAEASCRERFGPTTEWMTFLDADEYLLPMQKSEVATTTTSEDDFEYNWHPILDQMLSKNISVVQFRSSRAKPRRELMDELDDQSICVDPQNQKNERFPNTDRCISRKPNETFLHVYNCEYIRSPKPSRFDRARKQIYRPSYVWNHFVHYSTITADNAETYKSFQERPNKSGGEVYDPTAGRSSFSGRKKHDLEIFADELKTGVLVHARSVLPHETRRVSEECFLNSKVGCMVGFLCEDTVEFIDSKHKDNVFHNTDGSFCNCWKNNVIEDIMVPQLERLVRRHLDSS